MGRLRLFDDDNIQDMLITSSKIKDFKDSEALELLNMLTPENLNVFLTTGDKSQHFDKKNSFKQFDYRKESLPHAFIEASKTIPADSFKLPPPNKYFPANFDVLPPNEEESK